MTRVRAIVPTDASDDALANGDDDMLIGNCEAMQEVYRSDWPCGEAECYCLDSR